ncbi:hypothetical protein ACFDR9_005317, partial [Janthinobacterium sp. CG_23.3]
MKKNRAGMFGTALLLTGLMAGGGGGGGGKGGKEKKKGEKQKQKRIKPYKGHAVTRAK